MHENCCLGSLHSVPRTLYLSWGKARGCRARIVARPVALIVPSYATSTDYISGCAEQKEKLPTRQTGPASPALKSLHRCAYQQPFLVHDPLHNA
jgi:hypothetical protein